MRFIKNYWPILIIIVIGLFLPQTWFKNGYLINNGDFAFPMRDLLEAGTEYFYTWVSGIGTGVLFARAIPVLTFQSFLVLTKISGLSLVVSERLLFSLLFASTGLSMYFFTITLLRDKTKHLWALFSSLLYMFNPYALVIVWYSIHGTVFFYALFPFVLAFFIRGLRAVKFSFSSLFLFNLFMFLINFAFAGPPIIFVAWFSILLILIYFLIFEREKSFSYYIKFVFFYFISWLTLNAWWFLPTFFTMREAVVGASVFFAAGSRDVADILQSSIQNLITISLKSSFLNLFRNFSHPRFLLDTLELGDKAFSYGWVYFTPLFLLLSFIPTVFIFCAFLIKDKTKKLILYFGLIWLLLLFLVKGYHTPLGREFYTFLFEKSFFAQGFRDPQEKFGTMWLIVSSLLFGGGVWGFYTWLREKGKNILAKISVAILSVLIFVVLMFPFWTGQVAFGGGKTLFSQHVSLPSYYKEAYNWLSVKEDDFKIFPMPDTEGRVAFKMDGINGGIAGGDLSYRWLARPVLSNDKSNTFLTLVSQILAGQAGGEAQSLLGLLNTKYVLYHRDIIRDFFPNFESDEYFKDQFLSQGLKLESSFGSPAGGLDFYKINDEYFLPRIYITNSAFYVDGNQEAITHLIPYLGREIQGGFFFPQEDEEKNDFLEKQPGKTILQPSLVAQEKTEDFHRVLLKNAQKVPFLRFLPDSPLYFLSTLGENVRQFFVKGDEKKNLLILNILGKRMAEIQSLLEKGKVEKANQVFEKYLDKLAEFKQLKINQEKGLDKTKFMWAQLEDLLDFHEVIITLIEKKIVEDEFEADKKNLIKLKTNLKKTAEFIDFFQIFEAKETKIGEQVYEFNVSQDGEYEIIVKNNFLANQKFSFQIDNRDLKEPQMECIPKWCVLDKQSLISGRHYLKIFFNQPLNLISDGSFETGFWSGVMDATPYFWGKKKIEAKANRDATHREKSLELSSVKHQATVFQPIANFSSDTYYRISFDYKNIEGAEPHLYFWENQTEEKVPNWISFEEREEKKKTFITDKVLLPDRGWRHFETVFKSKPSTKTAGLALVTLSGFEKTATNLFDNVWVEPLLTNSLYLRSVSAEQKMSGTPKIIFQKIDPTKYEILVEKAENPYFLVFSETFDPSWKAYIMGKNNNINIITTWFKKSLSEDRHFLINGYANSWYLDEKGDYKIILEYFPQRFFYWGVIIFGLAFISIFLLPFLKHLRKAR